MGVADLVLVLLRAPPAPLLTKICHCDLHRKVPDLLCLLKVYLEGTHIVIPWSERPIIYNVRARPNLVESTSGSQDLQMVPTPGIGLRCGCTRGCSTLSTRRLFASSID